MNSEVSQSPFAALGLNAASLTALRRVGYEVPTPVQTRAIPEALAGRDVIACAATGTGKTAAFALPLLERLERAGAFGPGPRASRSPLALVLAPTRELALQIAEHIQAFGRDRRVRVATIIGGVGMEPQVRALREGTPIVIATPGRLVDHLERGSAKLDGIQVLVLDEADRMLDMGFRPQLDRILRRLPKTRQTMLFSATMAGEVASFSREHLAEPVRVDVTPSGTLAPRASQQVFHVPQEDKARLLLSFLSAGEDSTLVFTRTKRRADRLAGILSRAGHAVACIHADRSMGQRRQALDGFRQGTYRVLVATDIAARGIDVEDIGHVVNFDLSHTPTDHVHRVGRTARAEKSGRASSFVSPEERSLLRDIEKFTQASIPRGDVPAGLARAGGTATETTMPAMQERRGNARPSQSSFRRKTGGSFGRPAGNGFRRAGASQGRRTGLGATASRARSAGAR